MLREGDDVSNLNFDHDKLFCSHLEVHTVEGILGRAVGGSLFRKNYVLGSFDWTCFYTQITKLSSGTFIEMPFYDGEENVSRECTHLNAH